MGTRGPLPLPANVHRLRGNPGNRPLADLLDGAVRPEVAVPSCPAMLDVAGRAEWKRITPHLKKLGLISQIDRAALTGYCQAWSDFVWARGRIAELNKDDPTGERGRIGITPSGYRQISELQQISNRSLEQLEKFLAHFGMSPSLRSRVTASDPQLPLPGVEPKKTEGGWATFP